MRMSELYPFLRRAWRTRTPVMLEGPPGLGKSEGVKQFANRMAAEEFPKEGFSIITFIMATASPLDVVTYMPDRASGKLKPFFNERWPEKGSGIIFLDEAGSGTNEVRNAMQQFVQTRELNGFKLSDGFSFVGATNRAEDRAGAGRMGTAWYNRFCNVTMEFSASDTVAYFKDMARNPVVTAFLENNVAQADKWIYDFAPDKKVFASPRTWERVAFNLDDAELEGTDITHEMIAGLVGPGPAAQFEVTRKFFINLVSFPEIVADPKGAKMHARADELYAVSNIIYARTTPKNFKSVSQYVDRFPDEVGVSLIKRWSDRATSRDINKKFPEGQNFVDTSMFSDWFMGSRWQKLYSTAISMK